MKCIIIKDIFDIFQKRKFLILIYFVCLISISFFSKYCLLEKGINTSDMILGFEYNHDSNIIIIIFLIFNLSFYIYLSYYAFLKDIISDYGNIFSRITKIKWLISKLVSIIIIMLTFKIISYVIVYMIFRNSINILDCFNNCIFILLLQLIALILYSISTKLKGIKIAICIIIIFFVFFSYNMRLLTSNYYHSCLLIILFILALILYFVIIKMNIKNILERN